MHNTSDSYFNHIVSLAQPRGLSKYNDYSLISLSSTLDVF